MMMDAMPMSLGFNCLARSIIPKNGLAVSVTGAVTAAAAAVTATQTIAQMTATRMMHAAAHVTRSTQVI